MAMQWCTVFLPTFFTLVAALFVLLDLFAGVNSALAQLSYLQINTNGFSAPAKLSNSTFLADLSTVSGGDLVGQPASAASLGLATSYTINLLTVCERWADGSLSCTRPQFGFSFNPASDLSLDSTSLQGTFSTELTSALSSYRRTVAFAGAAYVLVVLFSLISIIIDIFNSRIFVILAATLASLAAVLALAASIALTIVFKKVNSAYNANFNASGMSSTLGVTPLILGFVAFACVLTAAAILTARAWKPAARGRMAFRGVEADGKASRGLIDGEGGEEEALTRDVKRGGGEPTPGLWNRVSTFNRHKYVQIQKQPAVVRATVTGSQEAVVMEDHEDPEEAVQRRLDDDWAAEDDYSHPSPEDGDHIPMLTLGRADEEEVTDTATEPFRDTVAEPFKDTPSEREETEPFRDTNAEPFKDTPSEREEAV